MSRKVRRTTVATLKGGPGKTTTAWYLALGKARKGRRVVAIDADPRSQGLTDWYGMALRFPDGPSVPFVVVSWPESSDLARFAREVEEHHGADEVVIDTGGERPDVFARACIYSDQLVSPVGPMVGEVRRLPATLQTVQDAAAVSPIDMAVLLTRVPDPGRGAALNARNVLSGGYAVLRTEIVRRERMYADAWGTVPDDLGEYGQLVDELDEDGFWSDGAPALAVA